MLLSPARWQFRMAVGGNSVYGLEGKRQREREMIYISLSLVTKKEKQKKSPAAA